VVVGYIRRGINSTNEWCDAINEGAATGCDAASEQFSTLCFGLDSCNFFATSSILEHSCKMEEISTLQIRATCTIGPSFGVDAYFKEWSVSNWGAARSEVHNKRKAIKNVLESSIK
jgi:hypothetical protein